MATFQVPVWFNIEAKDAEDAVESIFAVMKSVSTAHPAWLRIDDWVVEEPVHIHTEEN